MNTVSFAANVATSDGILKMPAPMTRPTTMATTATMLSVGRCTPARRAGSPGVRPCGAVAAHAYLPPRGLLRRPPDHAVARRVTGHGYVALDRVALDPAAEAVDHRAADDGRGDVEAHLLAIHLEPRQAGLAATRAHLAGHHLEFLVEVENVGHGLAADQDLRFPRSAHVRGNDVEVDVALPRIAHCLLGHDQGLLLVVVPLAHRVVVRHDPRSRLVC